MLYRVAIERISPQGWRWTSTVLSSLDTLFHFLRVYPNVQLNRLRVFSSSSHEELNEQLLQENQGLKALSVPADQFLQEHRLCVPETVSEAKQDIALTTLSTQKPQSRSDNDENTLDKTSMSLLDKRRIELEFGMGGDHDCPYDFSVPISSSQIFSWKELLLRIQDGVLQP